MPEDVRAALAATGDYGFDFEQPGFYALVRFVKQAGLSPGFSQTPVEVQDWTDLFERPADFRGKPVTISGVIGRNKNPYKLAKLPELGYVYQVELRDPGSPLSATIIFTEDVSDLPVDSQIRLTGYFVLIRQFTAANGQKLPAALIVARGPSEITRATGVAKPESGPLWPWVLVVVVAASVVVWIILRQSARAPLRRDLSALRAAHAAPMNLSAEFIDWAQEGRPPLPSADDSTAGEREARDSGEAAGPREPQ